jgi:hypothetical protein
VVVVVAVGGSGVVVERWTVKGKGVGRTEKRDKIEYKRNPPTSEYKRVSVCTKDSMCVFPTTRETSLLKRFIADRAAACLLSASNIDARNNMHRLGF